MDNWIRLLTFATLMFSKSDSGYNPIRHIWDSDFADSFDSELEVQSLTDFFTDFPMYEQRGMLEYVLLNPQTAGPALRRARGTDAALCQISPSPNSRRSEQSVSEDKRYIYVFDNQVKTTDIPLLISILSGIEQGDLSLHYARWQWQSGRQTASPAGPFLELAYWIGPVAGVPSPQLDLAQYRDNRYRGRTGDDRWVGK